jgi:diguanylate cyclase (GGDEF)-like protein
MGGVVRKAFWLALSVVGIGAIGIIDYGTGSEYRIFPLYYLPVSLGAWHAGWPAALGLAVASSATWVLSNAEAGEALGGPFVLSINFAILMLAAGCVGALVTVLRLRLDAERDLGRVDSLTGLPNRRAFYERGELLLAAARRYGHPVVIAYLDLDGFKVINDTYGHAEGDLVLQALGAVLRRQTRAADLAARLGGDEFALLLVETDAEDASVVLERLRRLIEGAMRASRWPITLTIGAVAFPAPPTLLDEAIRRADAALYAAKRAGKRRVLLEMAEPVETEESIVADKGD